MENSKISWTHHTFNPWIGCTKVSDGCKNCYAESLMDKRYHKVKWGPQGTRRQTSAAYWRQPLKWEKEATAQGWRYRVFCASLADVFENRDELIPWRNDLFQVIEQTPHLDWLLLTKRPENIAKMTPLEWCVKWPEHVWVGTSVEDQDAANKRIPELLRIPARVHFLSCEPLLGPVDLGGFDYKDIDWVIVGGESQVGARPMDDKWLMNLRYQCTDNGIPFFVKQMGGHPDPRHEPASMPVGFRIREFPRITGLSGIYG